MPQTSKKTLIKIISEFNPYIKDSLARATNFWNANGGYIKKIVENKGFSKSDFDSIKGTFKKFNVYQFIKENSDANYKEKINESLLDMCKCFIALQIQFNDRFDKTLDYIDHESSYYKKLKSLYIIRFFNGTNDEYKSQFKEISNLLFDVINDDFTAEDDCCNLITEYLNKVFENNSGKIFNPCTNIERINYLYKFGKPEFVEILRNNNSFMKWFVSGIFSNDDRASDVEGTNNIINEIFSSRDVSDENRKVILEKINPILSEYIEKINDYKESEEYFIGKYVDFLAKYRGIKVDKITDINYEDIDEDYYNLYNKYFGKLNERSFVEFDNYDAKNIENFIYSDEFVVQSQGTKTILGCLDKFTKNQINSISEILNSNSVKLKKFAEDWRKTNTGQEIKIKPYKFKVCNLEEDFRDIIYIKRLKETAELKYSKLFGCHQASIGGIGELAGIDEIVWNIHSEINKIQNYYSKDNQSNYDLVNTDNVLNSNIKALTHEIKKLNYDNEEKLSEIRRLNMTIAELNKKIDHLTTILNENKIVVIDESNKKLIERRKKYKITVVGGRDNINNGFNNICKNKEFLKKLNYSFHLNVDQFKLKGNFDMQKNKKFAEGIKTSLETDPNRFVIVLQSDHRTELFNLMNNPIYSSRITFFGELDEKGNISKINQQFSNDKFEYYLKKAIDKFETASNNSSIALG